MSDILTAIKHRRSIRRFTDDPVTDEQIAALIEAVQWAPSWANTQCWEIIVIKDADTKARLAEITGKGNPATKGLVQAPVVLGLVAKLGTSGYYKEQVTTKFGDWFLFDMGIAAENICLAADAMGLGTVIVGLFDHEAAGKVLGVPEGFDIVALIPVGTPAKESSAPKRKDPKDFVHKETFGAR